MMGVGMNCFSPLLKELRGLRLGTLTHQKGMLPNKQTSLLLGLADRKGILM
jgi:hypothetical protein